jgi:hypothetical protein
MIEVRWIPPFSLPATYTKANIERSLAEQFGYSHLTQVDTFKTDGTPTVSFLDQTGDRMHFYVIRFVNPDTKEEYPDFSLGIFPFSPREKRLLSQVVGWIPDIFKPDLDDMQIGTAFRFSINQFNVHAPETAFSIDSFPNNYEQYLVMGTQINLALLKFLKISIRDFSYSDVGFALTIDRGAKINQAIQDLGKMWSDSIAMAKFNFVSAGIGLGTVPLPIGFGGQLNRGLLNVLDIFNMMGR